MRLMKELTAKFEEFKSPKRSSRPRPSGSRTRSRKRRPRGSRPVCPRSCGLLDASTFSTASDEQRRLVTDIKKLIAILTEDDDERKKEEERLRKWKEEIKRLIKEENASGSRATGSRKRIARSPTWRRRSRRWKT